MIRLLILMTIGICIPNTRIYSKGTRLITPQGFGLKCVDQNGFVVANKPDLIFGISGPINESLCIKD